jgi:sirohydrochlorin cobaltochelatase
VKTGLLIIGHGSREEAANAELEAFVRAHRARHPQLPIAHGYVELARPPVAEAIDSIAGEVDQLVVLPLMLFAAGHVKNDLPLELARARQRHPNTRLVAARELGVHPAMLELAFARAAPALGEPDPKTAVAVVGRGSSDPDANGEFCKLVRLFAEGRNRPWVLPCFAGITTPRFDETAELLARARPNKLVVVPYLLFGGRLIEKLRQQAQEISARFPWVKLELAPHLGAGDLAPLHALVDERVEEALTGGRPLPCDTCQYRAPVSGVASNVGGLKAMLWAVRHNFTHTQAMPHVHAHKPLAKHVLVCTNADCAERGSVPLVTSLRRAVADAGRTQDIRITRTGCMGRCGEGPAVAVYPDGIWYRAVAETDAEELVREHLLQDRLVARLVDHIMQ